jgi:DNA-binding MarR family transcriptional regulator/N-acetylglutamate synthase-like GNAT family acetyltransferase
MKSSVEEIRRFNRFYTRQLGLLDAGLLQSRYSLTEVRVLYELAQRDDLTASDLGRSLGLDAGYLSRMLAAFQRGGLIRKREAADDGRRALLMLTKQGRAVFTDLDARASQEVRALLGTLSADDERRLVSAMHAIEDVLAPRAERVPYILRAPGPGDMGWVVSSHGILYDREYGWNEEFEALVATIVGDYVKHHDAKRERCWIAERHGQPVGSVFLVKKSEQVAQLRLLLVEPSARGLGIGARLVDECARFARQAGYRKIVLWTNSVLVAARRIYQRAGYRLVEENAHESFGKKLVGQTWQLEL